MKTGNTRRRIPRPRRGQRASMEPGHEDREYIRYIQDARTDDQPQWSPVMKTGNTTALDHLTRATTGLNGARS